MKKITAIIFLCILLYNLSSCYIPPAHDIKVYRTPAGEKYHREYCRYVRGKGVEINLSKAIHDGYEPCKVCRPPTKEDLDKLNEEE